ncbi:hypothetical protein EVAR_46650_1 [Eumeta japonica]|uniref:Uncharacterized protein n=1 Tax=Eumeta variegata TaxID=151549 RepID=A0A4C1WF93_EUMVA|nr:hypothetical protein EVAR_46650_1 [Eumeta japonica]
MKQNGDVEFLSSGGCENRILNSIRQTGGEADRASRALVRTHSTNFVTDLKSVSSHARNVKASSSAADVTQRRTCVRVGLPGVRIKPDS